MDDYDTDILIWSEHQAELLRRRAAGELVNEADLDWRNLAEEIEDVGRSERNSVRSDLTLALLHDLKAEAWPLAMALSGWRAEAQLHRRLARQRFTPGMRQSIDVASPLCRCHRRLAWTRSTDSRRCRCRRSVR